MKCTGERVVRFLVCLQVVRPFPVISTVRRLNRRDRRGDHRGDILGPLKAGKHRSVVLHDRMLGLHP